MYKEIVVLIALETLLVCGIYCVTMPIQQDIDDLNKLYNEHLFHISSSEGAKKVKTQISRMELTRNTQILIGFVIVLITCLAFYGWVKVLGWKDNK